MTTRNFLHPLVSFLIFIRVHDVVVELDWIGLMRYELETSDLK